MKTVANKLMTKTGQLPGLLSLALKALKNKMDNILQIEQRGLNSYQATPAFAAPMRPVFAAPINEHNSRSETASFDWLNSKNIRGGNP